MSLCIEEHHMPFVKGHAVVVRWNGSDFLRSFHDTEERANEAASRTIDLYPLRVVEAEVLFADNGNIRMWRKASEAGRS